MLKVRNFSLARGSKTLFSDLSFHADEREIVGVVGPTGCGKTSLVMALAGLLSYRGSVTLLGRELSDYDKVELASKIGVALEDPEPYFITQRVRDEVAFPLENLGHDPECIRSRVEEALNIVGLGAELDSYVHELSGGQKHRLTLATALATDPPLLILDNPLAHLDPPTASEFTAYLRGIADGGKSILITGHDKRTLSFADRLVELSPLPAGREHSTKARIKASGDVVVSAQGLYYAYEDHIYAVRDVSFTLRRGEVVALVGRNGAGKTTLGKLTVGLLKPSRGRVTVDGRRPGRGSSTYIFQTPDLQFIGRTVLEDVAFSIRGRRGGGGFREVQREAREYIEDLGLSEYADHGVYSLSRGMKRLATMASCVALEPKVMVLDEPDIGLDEHYISLVSEIIGDMSSRGVSIIAITHSLSFARRVAHRAWVMRDGLLAYDGDPADIRETDL